MKKTLPLMIISAALILFPTASHATYAVADSTAHALQQSHTTQEIAKLTEGLQKTQQIIDYAERARTIAGNPVKAVSTISAVSGLTPSDGMGKSMDQIADMASRGQNLSGRVQNLYRPLDLQNPLNSASLKSDNPYAPFQAVESAYSQYDNQLTKSQSTVKEIRKAIDEVNRSATTEAEQRQKQADLAALSAKLTDTQKEETDAFHALEAQKKRL
jgi:hypothetical protein